jgi:hypothetical protein
MGSCVCLVANWLWMKQRISAGRMLISPTKSQALDPPLVRIDPYGVDVRRRDAFGHIDRHRLLPDLVGPRAGVRPVGPR